MFTEEYDSGFQRLERFLATDFKENKADHQKSLDAIKNKNYGEALSILTDLADNKGDKIAQYNLSMLYSTGSGVERDLKKRIYYLEKSALQGYDEAKSELGTAYLNPEDESIQQDVEKGMSFLKEAASNGCVSAQYSLGVTLLQLNTTETDQEARRWFERAAEKNDPDALYNLGTMYLSGEYGVRQDYAKALELFERTSKQKWGEYALLKIALMYMRGMGVPKNVEKAFQIFKAGAEKGYPEAFFSLGAHYYENNDFEKAIEYFEKAQKAGWPNATEAIIEVKNRQRNTQYSHNTSNSGGGCFIATAVYGNSYSPEVLVLKKFRDTYLKKHLLGQVFIKNYYIYSPRISNYLEKTVYFKLFVKHIIISPIVKIIAKFI